MAREPKVTLTAPPRILVVDDSPALLNAVRNCLVQEGVGTPGRT
jgi:hypothetical protein